MPSTRRKILIGSSVAIGAIAGCQSVNLGESRKIGLTLRNYTDKEQPLQIELLREDKNEMSEASVLDTEYTVPAPGGSNESAGTIRETDLVPERRYIVRVLLKNGRNEQFHSHYYPDGSTGDEIDISIYRDETTQNLFVDFRALS
jgi:hypothetical protein